MGDGRVVDEDVHVAELCGHGRHGLSARRVLRHVGHHRQQPRPRKVLPQSGAHRLERSVALVQSGEGRAFLEQHAAPLAADAPGCAAHQRHAPLQLHPAHGGWGGCKILLFFCGPAYTRPSSKNTAKEGTCKVEFIWVVRALPHGRCIERARLCYWHSGPLAAEAP